MPWNPIPAVSVLLLGICLTSCSERDERPNILLITLDTTRADHLSCYGYERKTSPHLDRLAEEGQLFQRAVAVSSWTLPTHASLFTGLYPATHGAHYAEGGDVGLTDAVRGNEQLYSAFRANALPDEASTLAEILKEAGYKTAGYGAGPWLKPLFGLHQGFEEYDCDVDSTEGRKADEITALATLFLRRLEGGPFFLFLNYFDPHSPWHPPPELEFKFFPEEKVPLIAKDPKVAAQFDTSQYDGEIFFMDQEIGRLLDTLGRLDLFEDTWIIVTSDHGEHLGEHGLYFHGLSLFEPEVRCPLIIKWPKDWDPLPSDSERWCQVDILPTIIQRLGLEAPGPLEGRPMGKSARPVVCELYRNPGNAKLWKTDRFDRILQAIYHEDYKLILSSRAEDPDSGLFNLDRDPQETKNLASEDKEKTAELLDLLNQWRQSRPKPLNPKHIHAIDPGTEEQLKALGYGE